MAEKIFQCIDDAVTHVTLPGHFPRPGPDLRGARGIAPGVAGGRRGVERETIAGAGANDCGRKRLQAQTIAGASDRELKSSRTLTWIPPPFPP